MKVVSSIDERRDIKIKVDALEAVSIEQPNDAIRKALIERTGIHRYCAIMQFEGDVTDEESGFQKLLNGYYNVRRPEEWRRDYYSLFQEVREAPSPQYKQILRGIYERTGQVEASFATKMLATIDSSMPVWDRRVITALKRYDASLPVVSTVTVGGRIEKAIAGYNALCEACNDLLTGPVGKRCIERFDKWLGAYSDISSMKKLDVILWCAGD